MNQYRDFENDQKRFGYEEGARFLGKLHANHQHYVPIVDSAIYAPNPENASDAYPTFDRGVQADAFMYDAEGDLYIGAVWPGYTGAYCSATSLSSDMSANLVARSLPGLGRSDPEWYQDP